MCNINIKFGVTKYFTSAKHIYTKLLQTLCHRHSPVQCQSPYQCPVQSVLTVPQLDTAGQNRTVLHCNALSIYSTTVQGPPSLLVEGLLSKGATQSSFYLLVFFFGQSGEAYRWRICYQRCLPRLVFKEITKDLQNCQCVTFMLFKLKI